MISESLFQCKICRILAGVVLVRQPYYICNNQSVKETKNNMYE
ncbi:hypothetical protein ABIE50_000875 [Chitinophaga sp. OAE865]